MSWVIGLSGAQGGGKTSLLKELMNRNWMVDQFKVSRAVQTQLGWSSLQRVMDSPETMIAFQEEVFTQKYNNDSGLMRFSHDLVFTERTFADICAYTAHWTWKFVGSGVMTEKQAFQFMSQFTTKCAAAQEEIYNGTLLLPLMKHVAWEDDANRASKSDAGLIFTDVVRFLEHKMPVSYPLLFINELSVDDRANQVEQFIEKTLLMRRPI